MAVGGDITEIIYTHPTLGTGTIYGKASEDSTFNLGGFRTDDDEAGIDGGGNAIYKMNQSRWSFEVTVSWDMNSRAELEKVSALAASTVPAKWTISSINGVVYGGTGKPVGPYEGNGNAATFKLKLAGGGTLKAITGQSL